MCLDEYNLLLSFSKENEFHISKKCLSFINEDRNVQKEFMKRFEAIASKRIAVTNKKKTIGYIEKKDPFETMKNKDSLFEFITLSYNQLFLRLLLGDRYFDHLTKDISIKSKIREKHKPSVIQSDFETMLDMDISLLKNENFLSSRLATIIYRVSNLDPFASTTTCGRYFHKKIGSKSKVISQNQCKTWGSKYATRVYDLNIDETEKEIRKKIAKKLILLKIKKFDNEEIAKVTELPLADINNLY